MSERITLELRARLNNSTVNFAANKIGRALGDVKIEWDNDKDGGRAMLYWRRWLAESARDDVKKLKKFFAKNDFGALALYLNDDAEIVRD